MKTRSDGPTRDKIIAVSTAHFLENGHRGITMDALAELVGVSKKTLYQYFPSKLAILEAVMDRRFEFIYSELDAVRRRHEGNIVVCLGMVLVRWQELIREAKAVFWRDVQIDSVSMIESTAGRRVKIAHDVFGRIIRDGAKEGVFREGIDANVFAEMLMGALEGIIRSSRMQGTGVSSRELIVLLVKSIIEGTLSDKGRESWSRYCSEHAPIVANISKETGHV
jgi:AcrR family transcriptional regulator